jgi:hypothetical protein
VSRTDKDAPYWVRTEFYVPSHDWTCPDRIARSWQNYPRSTSPCPLPPEPVREPRPRFRFRGIINPDEPLHCSWVPTWPRKRRYNYSYGPTAADRAAYWWGPDRANVRDLLHKAKRQYNGFGDVDIVEPTQNHRHAMYSGGWWD